MTYIGWPYKTAVGSSYCLDQSPGAERFGGLTITLRWRAEDSGTVKSKATNYFRNMADLNESLLQWLAKHAEEGLRAAAADMRVNLNDFDITLSDFAYHPVDSRGDIYRHAAGSAFRAAFEAWERWYSFIAKAETKTREAHGSEQ